MTESNDEYIETLYAAPRDTPTLVLRHRIGSLAGTSHSFTKGTVHLGRRRDCDVRFDSSQDRMVSSRHARIASDEGRWILEDLGSTNGTYVNGREISGRIALAHGDEVVLGCDENDGSAGFAVELQNADALDDAVTQRPAAPPRPRVIEPIAAPKSPPLVESAPPPRSAGPTAPDSPEFAALRGELRALEMTIPATRAAAEMAARTLAENLWQRGGVDWSPCPSIAATLECERLAHEAAANAEQFDAAEVAERAASESRLGRARDRVHAAEERAAALLARQAAIEQELEAAADRVALLCEPMFSALDELSLVIADIVARHRPDADDDVVSDLVDLRNRMAPLASAGALDDAAVTAALEARRKGNAERAALSAEIVAHDQELNAARREFAAVEADESALANVRAEQRAIATRAANEHADQLAARFAALGAEATRLRLPGVVSAREFASSSAALGALDAAEKRIAEIRATLGGSVATAAAREESA